MKALTKISKDGMKSAMSFARDEEAATAAEYGILAALVAVVIIGAVTTFGTNLKAMFTTIGNTVAPK